MRVPSADAAIDAVALAKRFGGAVALRDFTLRVERGSVFGLLGPNGAGKTTAVKTLLGLVRPTAGDARVLGAPLGDRAARRRIGYLPELFRFPDWLTAREVLAFHCTLIGIPARERAHHVDESLAIAGLQSRATERVGAYSKGMQQRLGLAVALLGRPELVFLDEPTSALDPGGRHDVRVLLKTLRERGTTVVLNSHLLSEVEQVCDRVAIVRAGSVIASGTRDEIVGERTGLRIRAQANGVPLRDRLRAFGVVEDEAGGVLVRDLPRERTHEVVAALVHGGARIESVEPVEQTLEDRFLEIVGTP